MNNDNTHTPGSNTADAFTAVADAMIDFRDEMQNYDAIGTRIAARTNFILRTVFATLFVSSIYLVYMIFEMSSSMSIMTGHLESMYGRFGSMSQDMREITHMVDSMGNSISGIPVIAGAMTEMDGHVSAMSGSVHGMNTIMTAIDKDMVWIDLNMREMTGRLSNMNRAVNWMSHDVNEMAQPINSGPMSGFWPR
jgi:hypothetical protein